MTQTATHAPMPDGCDLCEHLCRYLDAPGYKCGVGWRLSKPAGGTQARPSGCIEAGDISGWLVDAAGCCQRLKARARHA